MRHRADALVGRWRDTWPIVRHTRGPPRTVDGHLVLPLTASRLPLHALDRTCHSIGPGIRAIYKGASAYMAWVLFNPSVKANTRCACDASARARLVPQGQTSQGRIARSLSYAGRILLLRHARSLPVRAYLQSIHARDGMGCSSNRAMRDPPGTEMRRPQGIAPVGPSTVALAARGVS